MRVAGVDGTRGGWAAIVLDNGAVTADLLLRPVETRFEKLEDVAIIGIDIPIGYGPRDADAAARRYLKGSASAVFTTPPRDILEQPFGPGLSVSAQAHALGPRVLHITPLAVEDARIREVHPEVSFRAMNRGQALHYRKKSAGGALERLALLRREGIVLESLSVTAGLPLDDVVDAAAAAWTANRIALGTARSLPDPPEERDGRRIAIWY